MGISEVPTLKTLECSCWAYRQGSSRAIFSPPALLTQNVEDSIVMQNESDWIDSFGESISQVNEQYGFGEQDRVSLFFKIVAGLNPIKLFVSAYNSFKGNILSVPISGHGTWVINQTRRLLFFFIPFAGIAAALVSATIEYKILIKLYDSAPMELSEITYKLPERIWSGGLHFLGVSDIRKQPGSEQLRSDQPGGEQQDGEQQNTSEKRKSWLPLMTAFAFETTKCFLIFYRSAKADQDLSKFKRAMTLCTSVLLIVISLAFTLIFFAALMNQQQLEEASKERHTEIEENYKERIKEKTATKAEQIASFEAEIKRLELREELLRSKPIGTAYISDIEQVQEDLKNEKAEREKYRESVDKEFLEWITAKQNDIEASKERRTEIEENYKERIEEKTAMKVERLASFGAGIKRLEELREELLRSKAIGTAYISNIGQVREDLKNEKVKLEEYRESVSKELLEWIGTKQSDISGVEKEIAKSSKADPEWMRKILNVVHKIFGGNTTDDYPRTWAHACIIVISLSVTAALESIIWCIFAIIGQESST